MFGIFLGHCLLLLPVCQPDHFSSQASTYTDLFDRETKQKTLEEVAAAFGDRVIAADDNAKRVSVVGEAQHVESAKATEP